MKTVVDAAAAAVGLLSILDDAVVVSIAVGIKKQSRLSLLFMVM